MADAGPGRLVALDLIRGVAVLGILAINIGGFAGPPAAIISPHLPYPGSFADELGFAAKFVLFEGKMRALFAILFGASLALFIERADADGRFGDQLQLRRLGWLLVFGLAHFYLLWWGDILFIYAVAGLVTLLMRELTTRTLVISASAIFAISHLTAMAMSLPAIAGEEHVRLGTASAAQTKEYSAYLRTVRETAREEIAEVSGGFAEQAAARIGGKTFQPLTTTIGSIGEILPLMLLGIALCRTGFFAGAWPARRLRMMAWLGTGSGFALTIALLAWAWARGFPPKAMEQIFIAWAGLPHLLMAFGYAAILVLLAPWIANSGLGKRIVAAGRMAFSNYLATTVVMTAIFYGWGLGLIGRFGHLGQWGFVLFGWILMLAWSRPWLSTFRRGPFEWLWRSLVERRLLQNRK